MRDLPSSAKAVVIGGGIVGCSTAYHLAKLGWTDTVLLERAKLTSGSTWHAAGLVGQLRSNANITQLLGYSVDLYRRLEAETGQATGWKMNGGLRLACTEDRWIEVKRQATTARSFGLEMHLLTPQEARDLWPLMEIGDLVGAAFLPTDGQASPSDITQALAKGARAGGVAIHEETPVTAIVVENDRVTAVETSRGRIETAAVVLCAGQWTRALAATVGVTVPLVSVQHQYLITEPIPGVTPTLPTLRDPDRLIYWKEEVGGLVMGGYEPDPVPWAVDGIPEGFHFQLLDADFDHFEQFMDRAIDRVPALANAGVKQLLNGPESFTPDGNFILGEAPELRGLFVGAGFNAFGIASGGGAGMALAEWVANGAPPYDLWPVDIRRFGRPHGDVDWVRVRTMEAYGRHYTIAWPLEEAEAGRHCRRSALYDRLNAAGACFGEKLGWERPNWFADAGRGELPVDRLTFGRPDWFDAVAREHRAAREAAALFDQSSFAKFEVAGPGAAAALDFVCAGDVLRPPGRITYTQMLNERGGIECDVTVARLADDRFYIVTGTGFATHDLDWIARGVGDAATVTDVTSAWGVLALMGPRAREILERVTRDDVSNAAFPFAAVRRLHVAGTPVRALRITYVGELGWELHVPTESLVSVYEALFAVGQPFCLADAGYRAIESLRLEKGYRAWAADIGPDHTPIEAGLGWTVKLRSNRDFRGRAAVAAQARDGVSKLLAGFTLSDPSVMLWGRETILRDGARVGWLSSAGFGHTVGRPIGYGYVRHPGVSADWLRAGRYELEVAGDRHPAEPHLEPLYDPGMARVRA
jgi:glycine cleavage system aminomethyltransferase T/glycine/D-amino acid oxidase-like deaminating enzyme